MPTIRELQHFLYCPRRFALIKNDCRWAENFFVVRAEIAHDKVHSGEHSYSCNGKAVYSNISVFNDDYDLHGVLDCVEFVKAYHKNGGAFIPFLDGRYDVRIVEYKPTAAKNGYRTEDALQMYAQKVCADAVWNCDSQCFLYYSNTHRRERIPFEDAAIASRYEELLLSTVAEVKRLTESGEIPHAAVSPKCSGCSFYDYCIPKVNASRFRDTVKKECHETTS